MFSRLSIVLASLLAASGLLILLSEVALRDQAALFASIALFAAAVGVYAVGAFPAPTFPGGDVWENIRWGRLFVALVYVSIAVICFAAMLHAPDFGRFVHSLHAI